MPFILSTSLDQNSDYIEELQIASSNDTVVEKEGEIFKTFAFRHEKIL